MRSTPKTLLMAFGLLLCFHVGIHGLVFTSVAHAETYYVSGDGDDKNSGTLLQPWKSLQKGADMMMPGDTLIIKPGEYGETVYTKHGGTSSRLITFQGAAPGAKVKAFYVQHDYIRVTGLEFGGEYTQYKAYVTVAGNYAKIQNNFIKEGGPNVYGIKVTGSRNLVLGNTLDGLLYPNIQLDGSNNIVQGNTIRNTPHDAMRIFGRNHQILSNFFNEVNDTGLSHTDLWQSFSYNANQVAIGIVVKGNFALNCKAQVLMLEDQTGKGNVRNWTFTDNLFINVANAGVVCVPNVNFINNTFFNSGKNTFGPIRYVLAGSGTIRNNIFVGCGSRSENTGWHWIAKGLKVKASGNFVAKGPFDSPPWGPKNEFVESGSINGGNPGFKNPDSHDYRPDPKGLAKGKGARIVGFVR